MSKSEHKKLRDHCDRLWSECVKLRAGMRSEYSGKTERLCSHHLIGKACYRLRYELENGYCCTAGEHNFIFHVEGRRDKAQERVRTQRGDDIFERLKILKWIGSTSLDSAKVFLERELIILKSQKGTSLDIDSEACKSQIPHSPQEQDSSRQTI